MALITASSRHRRMSKACPSFKPSGRRNSNTRALFFCTSVRSLGTRNSFFPWFFAIFRMNFFGGRIDRARRSLLVKPDVPEFFVTALDDRPRIEALQFLQ